MRKIKIECEMELDDEAFELDHGDQKLSGDAFRWVVRQLRRAGCLDIKIRTEEG